MGILSDIFHKIFPPSHPAVAQQPQARQQAAQGSMQSAGVQPAQPAPQQAVPAPAAAPMPTVDVEAVLERMAAANKQTLNWRNSIVDLLKLLNLDSSLEARKELARELDYPDNGADSAAMNTWLHREVMQRLAANGGKVPEDMKS